MTDLERLEALYLAQEKEIIKLQADIAKQEVITGLLLEMLHQIVIDMHAPKAMWDRAMIPIWKAHIEKKKELKKDETVC